ncbi:hypothetical protein DY000_02045972 [Brassica cretica]|uniref:CAP-Gly domain-containing protein n=1 Tax=Brassica cretica TaxID=69181 RepID=A0ABQ7F6W0_BRACR|nr:hypothetical protein DY000_02045972 [Brassica cretica]
MKAGVPWPRKKVKNIRRLRLNLIRAKRQLGRSAPLAGLLAHSAEAAGSQLISARQTVRISGRWPWAKSRGLGEWVGLVIDPKPNQKGRWGASCREGTTLGRWCPFASKSCLVKYSEKNVEREKERERESSGQGKVEFRVVRFPATLIVCEATSDQDGRSRQGEERGEPRGGSEAPLAGLLAHSAGATWSQLISAQWTVWVSGRWSGYGPVAGCEVQSWGHGPLGLGTWLWAKSRRLGNLRSSMGDRDQEKNMENPDTVQKVRGGQGLHQTERTVLVIAPRLCPRDTSLDLAVHNRTASLDTGRLCGWFESHH